MTPAKRMQNRLELLQKHLKTENPVLVSVVKRYRELDKVAQRMGLIKGDESYATQISWWPLVSVLGTFSAGKSSFINYVLGRNVQTAGVAPTDDCFTVIAPGPIDSGTVFVFIQVVFSSSFLSEVS